jgi:D-tagatose-1,6-bisphosphate aldolase subunit GatZ/KbaZ
MQPTDFAALVIKIAAEEGCPQEQIILGGDHLGPNPWRHLPAEEALTEAEAMLSAYVAAGFRKIHLDASMGCAGEPAALDDKTTATRAARLAAVAERVAGDAGGEMPLYIIGTEVPPPGGADHILNAIDATSPRAAKKDHCCTLGHFHRRRVRRRFKPCHRACCAARGRIWQS